MISKKVIGEWFRKAKEDFDFASANLIDSNNTFFAQICFHFHQAAEKYLKTYIVAYKLEFKKIGDYIEKVLNAKLYI